MKPFIISLAILLNAGGLLSQETVIKIPGCTDSSVVDPWKLSLQDYTQRLADKNPVVGGGFVCVVAGTEATALIIMTLKLSEAKQKSEADKDSVNYFIRTLGNEIEKLSCFASKDKEAYKKVLEALRLPQSTPLERSFRDSAIYMAKLNATEVPVGASASIAGILLMSLKAAAYVSGSLITDVGAAASLLNASADGLLLFAEVNSKSFHKQDKEKIEAGISNLKIEIANAKSKIQQYVAKKM